MEVVKAAGHQIASGEIGTEGKYDVKFENGKLKASLQYQGAVAGAGLQVEIDADSIIDALVAKTENKIDDALAAFIKAALKS